MQSRPSGRAGPRQSRRWQTAAIREQISKEHNWENIFGKIWDGIAEDIENHKLANKN